MTLLDLPIEVLAKATVFLHPHQLHSLKRLSRNAASRLLLPPSFAFAHTNLMILKQQPGFNWRIVLWHKLGINYIAALFAIFGVSYQSLAYLGVLYEEATVFDLEACEAASLVPAALMLAAHHDSQYLRRVGKPINWTACDALCIQISAISGWTHVLRRIFLASEQVSKEYRDFALDLAAQNGHLELVNYLLTLDVNLSYEKSSAFRHACMNGHYEVVKALAMHYTTKTPLDPVACDGYPLIKACKYGHARIVSFLLQAYPEVNPMAFQGFALQVAIESGHCDVIRLLVEDWRMDWKVLKKEYQDLLSPFVSQMDMNKPSATALQLC
ncbi:hypothetical protein HDU79_005315 [Rhizoclosmatium sp. JEL0117]|nr:hypothetical protein HDU79_005315 [Rhizoclosmatium sp. JEL0117]